MGVAVYAGGQSNQQFEPFQGSLVELRVEFHDPDGAPVDVTNEQARLTLSGEPIFPSFSTGGMPDSAGFIPLVKVTGETGLYSFDFLTDGLQQAAYLVTFTGDIIFNSAPLTLTVQGTAGIGEISKTHAFMDRLRIGLMDNRHREYKIDRKVPQWNETELFIFLREALQAINSAGPQIRRYTFDTFPTDVEELLITGGRVYALEARSRLEIANELTYTDGHTLSIDRAQKYMAMAQQLRMDWLQRVRGYITATPPKPIGVQSQRLPFRITRVIGLLPNYSNFFTSLSTG